MSFKAELLKKIKIDRLAETISRTIGTVESGRKLDRAAMRQLLKLSPLQRTDTRDLELYVSGEKDLKEMILVLDNDIGIYRTSIEDVALRKSPTVKEMISIRNAIKILNDADVLVSKKEKSLKTIHNLCLGQLDLSYDRQDLKEIAEDGKNTLADGNSDGVRECLSLFAELLGLKQPPKPFSVTGYDLLGRITNKPDGSVLIDTIVLYHSDANTLRLLDKTINNKDKEAISEMSQIAVGEKDASFEGAAVIDFLEGLSAKKI